MNNMNITLANDTEGCLITVLTGSSPKIMFRVYADDGTFVDYDIMHSDLFVRITDSDSAFYEKDGKVWLDHAPETLGIKKG